MTYIFIYMKELVPSTPPASKTSLTKQPLTSKAEKMKHSVLPLEAQISLIHSSFSKTLCNHPMIKKEINI